MACAILLSTWLLRDRAMVIETTAPMNLDAPEITT
jgi:hypothetical protein